MTGSAALSPEADQFLAEATREFNAAQKRLDDEWQLPGYERWEYDPASGVLELTYADGSKLFANGQLLGTHCVADRTFEWAWNSPHFRKAPIAAASREVKALGRRLGISYLVRGMIPVPTEVALSYVCAIALKATGASGLFRGAEGDVHPLLLLTDLRRSR
jgi:hypothetical protein